MNNEIKKYTEQCEEIIKISQELPNVGLGAFARIHAACAILVVLETINTRQNENPLPLIAEVYNRAKTIVSSVLTVIPELDQLKLYSENTEVGVGHTIDLFEKAWTGYPPSIYEH